MWKLLAEDVSTMQNRSPKLRLSSAREKLGLAQLIHWSLHLSRLEYMVRGRENSGSRRRDNTFRGRGSHSS